MHSEMPLKLKRLSPRAKVVCNACVKLDSIQHYPRINSVWRTLNELPNGSLSLLAVLLARMGVKVPK
jgi:hypothetical protein